MCFCEKPTTKEKKKKVSMSALEKHPESISSPVWELQASPGTIEHRKFQEMVMAGGAVEGLKPAP